MGSEKRAEYKEKFTYFRKQQNVSVWRCHVSEHYNTNFIGRLWAYFSFMFSSVYAGLFKAKDKYDVILVTSPPLFVGITAYVLSKIKRIPFVFEVRDLWPESAIDTGVLKSNLLINMSYKLEKFFYKKASLINVLTPAFRKKLIEEKKVPDSKIIFIPNAADFSLSEQLLLDFNRDQFRIDNNLEDRFVITYVGAHGIANHLQQILKAGKLLEDTNVLFLLIGQGMDKDHLIEMSREMEWISRGKRAITTIFKDTNDCLIAKHDGYKKYGLIHSREFCYSPNEIIISDNLNTNKEGVFHLHFYPGIVFDILNHKIVIKSLGCAICFEGLKKLESEDYDYSVGFNKYKKDKKLKIRFAGQLKTIIKFL